jgi:hypothetical protein
MLASLAFVPPSPSLMPLNRRSTTGSGTVGSAPSGAANESSAALDASAPISGPIPLPRMRPRISVARISGQVPLPRPRPHELDPG